jgi:hypothetical protein
VTQHEDMRLHEWIAFGRENGRIRDVRITVWAYCLDERQAIEWISPIVRGEITEQEALRLLEQTVKREEELALSA